MVRIEQGELLLAVGTVLGVVDIEHDPSRHLAEAVAEQLDHRRHHALERDRAGQVLQPRILASRQLPTPLLRFTERLPNGVT